MNKKINGKVRVAEGGKNRALGLDVLRISLAMWVFCFHSKLHFNCGYSYLDNFFRMGAIAMTGFFMLSGYSMHLSNSRKDLTKKEEIRYFYLKRLITILPLYFTIAIIRVIYDVVVGKSSLEEVAILFPVELSVIQSTFTSSLFTYSHNGGTWFISCILFCYLAYPYIQSLLLQLKTNTKIILLFVICSILLYAPFVQHYFRLDPFSIYTNPFYRQLEFCIGIIIAQINTMNSENNSNRLLSFVRKPYSFFISTFLLVALITMGRRSGLPLNYMMFNVISVPLFIVIIISLGCMKFERVKETRLLLYFSSISFTFFLCQTLPLWKISLMAYNFIAIESNIIRILLSFTICMFGAISIHHLIEKPVSTYLKTKFL